MKTVPETTLAFATIDRPHAVQRFVYSIRTFFPELPICVADQTEPTAYMREFYARQGVDVFWVPYDTGVGACRNLLVERTSTPFILMCDDDFVFTNDTDFGACLAILQHDEEVGIIGGRCVDKFEGAHEAARLYALFLELNRQRKTLTAIPAYHYFPDVRYVGVHKYFLCDTAVNFAFFRRDVFENPEVRWDARFKCNGEHEDFYLTFKAVSDYRVAFYPGLVCHHCQPPAPAYSRLRDRAEGWRIFMEKWGIEQYCELDNGTRIIAAPGRVQARSWGRYFASVGVVPEEEPEDTRFANSLTDDLQVILARHFDRSTGAALRSQRAQSTLYVDPSGRLRSEGGEAEVIDPENERAHALARLAAAAKSVRLHYRAPAAARAGDEIFLFVQVANLGASPVAVGPSALLEGAFRCGFRRDDEFVSIEEEAAACFADLDPGGVHEQLVRVRAPTRPGIYDLILGLTAGNATVLVDGARSPILVEPAVDRTPEAASDSGLLVDSAAVGAGLEVAQRRGIEWVRRAVRATFLARLDAAELRSLAVFSIEYGDEPALAEVELTYHFVDESEQYVAWDISRQWIRLRPGPQVRALVIGRPLHPRTVMEVAAVVPGEGYVPLFRTPIGCTSMRVRAY